MKTKRDPGKKTRTDQGRKTRTDPGTRPGQTSRRSELSQVRSPGRIQVTKGKNQDIAEEDRSLYGSKSSQILLQVELTNYCYNANLFLFADSELKDNGSNGLSDQLRRALGLDESFPKTYTGQHPFEIIIGK